MIVRTVVRDIARVDGAERGVSQSTNELLLDPDVTGVKTGYTSKAGRCLIASMFKDGQRLLLVGLNVMDRWEQATRLLRYGQMALRKRIASHLQSSNLVEIGVTQIFFCKRIIGIQLNCNAKFVDRSFPVVPKCIRMSEVIMRPGLLR